MANFCFVFSPTGGCAKAAAALCEGLGGSWQTFDLMRPLSPMKLTSEDLSVLAVPSFGGRVPALALRRLAALEAGQTPTVLLCVYGNRALDDTMSELQDHAEQRGHRTVAGVAAIAEHSILRRFAAGRPDSSDCAELSAFGRTIAARIAEGACGSSLLLPGAHGSYKPYTSTPFLPPPSPLCVGCRACVAACPTSALSADDPYRVDAAACIKCMRCAAVCPRGARQMEEEMLLALEARLAPLCTEPKRNALYLAEK